MRSKQYKELLMQRLPDIRRINDYNFEPQLSDASKCLNFGAQFLRASNAMLKAQLSETLMKISKHAV